MIHTEWRPSQEQAIGYVRRQLGDEAAIVGDWSCSRLGWQASNEVTGGLYRVAGTAALAGRTLPWSFVVKLVIPAAADEPGHYNYWRREALAYQSGLLEDLPGIRAPRCYGVEEQPDGSFRLWLEEAAGLDTQEWTATHYLNAAYRLGLFNGAYLQDWPLPDEPWLCRGWLSSWVAASEPYDDGSAWRADTWEHPRLRAEFPLSAAKRFAAFDSRRADLLAGLRRLPQVFTHNDAWPPNLIWGGDGTLTAIDWAFAGIAGVGEELGRMYGLCLHQSLPERLDDGAFPGMLLDAYGEGLHESGWRGPAQAVRYGFAASAGLRCGMLVPKLVQAARQPAPDAEAAERFAQRCRIARCLLERAEEAIALLPEAGC
ncbi:phosphotransferase family protein [Paenibacillus dendritiformis]|uniref:phosphotransferase family protein n=1 Tax=Paenibacillus dendritiformis TaxID=130049 RepID=UPI00387E1336